MGTYIHNCPQKLFSGAGINTRRKALKVQLIESGQF